MFAIEHALGLNELLVEAAKGQPGRQHCVLDVEKAIVERSELALLGMPDFGAGIGGRDREMHDLGDGERPIAHDVEATLIPIGVDDEVHRDADADRARDLECFGIGSQRDALAVCLEAVFVDRLEAEEEILKSKSAPIGEDLGVLAQHVRAGFEIIALADATLLDFVPNGEAVLGADEGNIVNDKEVGFRDGGEIGNRCLRARDSVSAAIERPGAAE